MIAFSLLEKLSLAILLSISVFLFWRQFSKTLVRIGRAKPDADYHLHPIAPRLFKLFSEVLCQSKVIRERPLSGLAHAFVFWGFLAFALVTVTHLSAGFGLPLLQRTSALGGLYFWFAFSFAALVAVSIAGLFVRRFLIRPKWLGALSYESGIIAALIFLLMATYMVEPLLHEGGTSEKANWWLHTIVLFAFLPLVPHTKHLHLVLSSLAIFLKHKDFAYIPKLDGDEDFGLDTGKDVTQLTALQAYSCVECGRCTEHCPANLTGKELNPKLIALGVRDYLTDYGNANEAPLLGTTISQTAVFQCTTCGACEYQCPVGIQHLPMIVGLRRGAVNTGKWEDEHGTKLFLNLEKKGNPMGFSPSDRDKFIAREQLPIFDGTQEYCLWLGCMGAYDPKGRDIVTSLVAIMRYLNTSFGVLRKEQCTGDAARRLGNDLVFSDLAEKNLANIKTGDVKKILSICPHCVRTIAEDWREVGATVTVEHHSEFLARYRDRLPRDDSKSQITYHDPCYLGRYRNVYDQPRSIVAEHGTLVEPESSRERGLCCGAGGGLVFLGEETGQRVSHKRAKQLADTGADTVAMACPFCNTMFQDAFAQVSDRPMELLDIAQLAARNLPRATAIANADEQAR